MNYKKVRFVGLDKDIWLPEHMEVIIDIVPSWRTNVRSNQKFTGQKYFTHHDTGNPHSNAMGERNYLHAGAGGRYVGYNFAVDAYRIIQLTPLDEVTWAAGTAEGNKYSWHMEQTLNTDWNKTLETCAALEGGICAAMGWNVDEALVPHQKWFGKWCPAQLLNKGLWPRMKEMAQDAKVAALAAAGQPNEPKPDTPTYAEASPIAVLAEFNDTTAPPFVSLADDTLCYFVNYEVEAIVETPRLRWAYENSPHIGPLIKKGERFTVRWIFQAGDGNHYYYTPWHTRVKVADTKRVV